MKLFIAMVVLGIAPAVWAEAQSALVHPGEDGKLVYAPDARGNTIPDFSNCGYMGGGVALPEVPVKVRVAGPVEGDNTAVIQGAIDQVAKMPLTVSGFRGAVLLGKGTYRIAGVLRMAVSGVVLRGEGDGEHGTVLLDTGHKQRSLIVVGTSSSPREDAKSRQAIVPGNVACGARRFSVASAAGFKVGQRIVVQRPSTVAWIVANGMEKLKNPWTAGSKDHRFVRLITGIEGNQITVDAPLCNDFQEKFGGGSVMSCSWGDALNHVGIENLRGDSEYHSSTDENHGWNFVAIGSCENGWVRNVTSIHFGYGCVNLGRWAKNITVQDCSCLDAVSEIRGGRRYSFSIAGQMNLVQRCFARNGRHDFVMSSVVAGPNVFLDCRAEQAHADTGPHHRWSCGTLFDNVSVSGNAINVQNRGNSGTGHGWAGAYMVYWNCRADRMDVQRPPTAENYAIGCRTAHHSGSGFWESVQQPVTPRSLYLAQLKDRLGEGAVTAIGKDAPRPAVDMTVRAGEELPVAPATTAPVEEAIKEGKDD